MTVSVVNRFDCSERCTGPKRKRLSPDAGLNPQDHSCSRCCFRVFKKNRLCRNFTRPHSKDRSFASSSNNDVALAISSWQDAICISSNLITSTGTQMARPSFVQIWNNFRVIYGDGTLAGVGNKIGGKVKQNIDMGLNDPKVGFQNGCAIRMSYSLNYSGFPVSSGPWKAVSGADKKQYIYRVADLGVFLKQRFGAPDKTVANPKPGDFAGMRGILVFGVHFRDATGHATLWDGNTCSDHCYFPVAAEASIWLLH